MEKKTFKERFASIFFPKRCAYCGTVIDSSQESCDHCQEHIERIEPPVCIFCGVNKLCCACKDKRNHYKRVVAPFYYEGIAANGIKRFKFRGKTYAIEIYANEISKIIQAEYADIPFDLAVYVPMTRKAKKQRGYNQSEELAIRTAEQLHIPVHKDLLVKLYEVVPQHALNARQRQGNVAGVFEVSDVQAVENKTILLFDDIKTTGATLNECAKMLRLRGAKAVYCACAAINKQRKP